MGWDMEIQGPVRRSLPIDVSGLLLLLVELRDAACASDNRRYPCRSFAAFHNRIMELTVYARGRSSNGSWEPGVDCRPKHGGGRNT
jgi:hypothetical protein